MKKLLSIATLLFLFLTVSSANELSVIQGKWEKGKLAKVNLYKIENSNLIEIATSAIDENKQFAFAFYPQEEGFYVIAPSQAITNRFVTYLKPGDDVSLSINAEGYNLVGRNTEENIEVKKWYDFMSSMDNKAFYTASRSTYVDFFPLLESKEEELASYPSAATNNSRFNEIFELYKNYSFISTAVGFLYLPRTAHPQDEDYPDFYRNINLKKFTNNTEILKFPESIKFLTSAIRTLTVVNKDKSKGQEEVLKSPILLVLESNLDQITNDTIKGELVVQLGSMNRTYEGFTDYMAKYGKYVITDSQRSRLKQMQGSLNDNTKGTLAIDFKFADVNGKMVSLSDFKGKVVYIDVWATWCGPCKKEIPSLKKLEEEYHNNKDIVFLSVSVDATKDKKKWEDMLKAEGLKGVQLFAGDAASQELMRPYKIKGIPRFILVDKDGKLISGDAPRPSSTEIRSVLNAALKK